MNKILPLVFLCILSANVFAQSSLTIDKLERSAITQAKKEVAFSALLEGTIADPDLEVFVFVHQPQLNRWRPFPATTDIKPEPNGQYRWRAICLFGELNGKGVGGSYQARAMAFDKQTSRKGLPEIDSASAIAAAKTEVIVLKRVK